MNIFLGVQLNFLDMQATAGIGEEAVKHGELYTGIRGLMSGVVYTTSIYLFIGIIVGEFFGKRMGNSKSQKDKKEEIKKEEYIGEISLGLVKEIKGDIQEFYWMMGSILDGDVGEVYSRLSEIEKVYGADKKINDIKMYQYEPMFREVLEAVKKGNDTDSWFSKEFWGTINKAISYPYEDIVKGYNEFESLEEEMKIQEALRERKRSEK